MSKTSICEIDSSPSHQRLERLGITCRSSERKRASIVATFDARRTAGPDDYQSHLRFSQTVNKRWHLKRSLTRAACTFVRG
jgi:hypothetical protein